MYLHRESVMAKNKIEIDGLDDLIGNLRELPKKARNKIARKALRKGQKIYTDEVKQNVAVLSGDYKRSIKTRAGKRSRKRISMETRVDTDTFKGDKNYFGAVEYGTSRMPPRGDWRRAADSKTKQVKNQLTKEISDGIEKEAKG